MAGIEGKLPEDGADWAELPVDPPDGYVERVSEWYEAPFGLAGEVPGLPGVVAGEILGDDAATDVVECAAASY